jgi:predicted ABC-type ATPase
VYPEYKQRTAPVTLRSTEKSNSLRMRVFAGPNGSGKSTVIKSVRNYNTESGKIDFGYYVNADELAKELTKGKFRFSKYKVRTNRSEFLKLAKSSGLLGKEFSQARFTSAFTLHNDRIRIRTVKHTERIAQILADFLRKKLLEAQQKFSFETVFSHHSKLDIMREAKQHGYKVYLYFVATNSPDINKDRVAIRVKQGGHDVPSNKIESRYYRSLEQLFDAAQICYQCFFFDNSGDRPVLFARFKQINGKKIWKKIKQKDVPDWFIRYYADKVKKR